MKLCQCVICMCSLLTKLHYVVKSPASYLLSFLLIVRMYGQSLLFVAENIWIFKTTHRLFKEHRGQSLRFFNIYAVCTYVFDIDCFTILFTTHDGHVLVNLLILVHNS